jgi:hypothetical protein
MLVVSALARSSTEVGTAVAVGFLTVEATWALASDEPASKGNSKKTECLISIEVGEGRNAAPAIIGEATSGIAILVPKTAGPWP